MYQSAVASVAYPFVTRPDTSLVCRLSNLIDDPDTVSVEQICDMLDISHPRLVRLCRSAFGHTPKYLLRRARFVGMLVELKVRSYAQWRMFLDPRYVDQSHFIRDFQFFLGMAPTRFLSLPDDIRDALAADLGAMPHLAIAA
jgi:methylphosphotriester-DNA--protein-cysteine methyltransferase